MPKILALGEKGIIALGKRVTDYDLAKHDLIPLGGEEAVYIPSDVIERYVQAALEQMAQDQRAAAEEIAAEHELAHMAQQGGPGEETTA